ncbi:MAG: RDD family protein [Lewinellaceae bacterium]|nr:RDD family protein [Lewinellaceae bacterium]
MLTLYLTVFLILFRYYTIMEAAFNGKTIGKLITRTRAVRKTVLPSVGTRSRFALALPFLYRSNPFRFLQEAWAGDSIPKTRVVNDPPRF